MQINLQSVSKRFQKHWIFRNISYTFEAGNAYALLGSNGSGKSTLLRLIALMQSPTAGKIAYNDAAQKAIPPGEVYKSIGFSAPGQELVDELTLNEFLQFHFSFKKLYPGLDIPKIIALTGLESSADKAIGDYSSGMRQRVKLAQAIFSDTPILFLDEPCTNLDQKGVDQYVGWMETYAKDRLVIVASNDVREYFFCREKIDVEEYK